MLRKRWFVCSLTIVTVLILACLGLGLLVSAQEKKKETKYQGKIAFVKEYSIWIMDADGQNQTKLTAGTKGNSHSSPCWSPDGKKILFVSSPREYEHEIHIMDADGQNQKRLAKGYQPVWSPDGKKITFAFEKQLEGRGRTYEIYVMNADGKHQKQLHRAFATHPDWSPDGKRIAFCWRKDICLIHPDGKVRTNLTNKEGSPARSFCFSPCWSPDGKKIAFVLRKDRGYKSNEIYVVDADGENLINLTNNEVADDSPCWSPDGTKIAFASRRDRKWGIYVMDAGGQNQMRLTDEKISGVEPCWSPDGTMIVFVAMGGG